MLDQLKKANSQHEIYAVQDAMFTCYGKILYGYECGDMIETVLSIADFDGPAYLASVAELEKQSCFPTIAENEYENKALQAGYVWGNNSALNSMEYHDDSEILIAASDLILILGHVSEINENCWHTKNANIFYVPKGTAVKLYETTLHFAPCRVSSDPFIGVIILPKGTNTPLDTEECLQHDPLYFMQNKWLLTLPGSIQAEKGAYVGIDGENIVIKPV